jgi:hypothetical protein
VNVHIEGQNALQGSWLEGLKTISPDEAKATEQTKPNHGVSEEGWNLLSDAHKDAILGLIGNSRAVSARMQILARLAECLQLQVDELEGATDRKPTTSKFKE